MLLVSPVYAADSTNLAGRPTNGYTNQTCHGTIYGKVNAKMVLFSAAHCNPRYYSATASLVMYNKAGKRIGVWESGLKYKAFDLSWIVLDTGMYPASNRNYITAVGSTFVNTYKFPQVSCTVASGRNAYQYFQPGLTNTLPTTNGKVTAILYGSVSGACEAYTSVKWHGDQTKDSGSPLIVSANMNSLFGVGAARDGDNLIFASWYQGMRNLNSDMSQGAWICSNSACT